MKRMLINATQEEELRMAMVDGQRLYDLNIEGPASERKKANIYKGKITRIEPSLEAAFVDYGADRHGFLPLKEVSSEYFDRPVESGQKPNIKNVLHEGQDIVVQIDKEERGNKGAALTTYVSLAGRFIVLKPNKSRSGGVSRRIVGSDRDSARDALKEIEIPDGMSVILRTAGIDRNAEELAWDLENLLAVWQAILNVVLERPSPFLIYRESNAVARALRDYLTNDVGEILIDDEDTYLDAVEQVRSVMPHNLRKLKHYTDPVPLFTRFQIESQIESAFAQSVTLPSGGSIVIDHTEALVSIDINSARATKGGDIEATALNTNVEAADEIARQLRIRDLGGLIVIDFIDMGPQKHQRQVENRLREAVRQDRARVQIGKISRFGLLEMSRQRLRPSIGESAYQTCPRCSGIGTIRSVESLALAILRIIGEEARKERTAKVIAQLPVEVATFLLNEKRDWVRNLESAHGTQVVLIANSSLETPHYDVRRVRDDQTDLPENAGASYQLAESEAESDVPASMQERPPLEQAAVGTIKPASPVPERRKSGGLIAMLTGLFGSGDEDTSSIRKAKKKTGKKAAGKKQSDRKGGRTKSQKSSADGKQAGDKSRTRKKTKKKAKSAKQSDGKPSARKPRKKSAPKESRKSDESGRSDDGKPASDGGDSGPDNARPARSRRSRGGRRRRKSADRDQSGNRQNEQTTNQAQSQEKAQAKSEQKGPARERASEQARSQATNGQPESKPDKPVEKALGNGASRPNGGDTAQANSASERPQPESSSSTSEPSPRAAEKPAKSPAEKPAEKPAADKAEGRLLPWDSD